MEFIDFVLQCVLWYFVLSFLLALVDNYFDRRGKFYNKVAEEVNRRIHMVNQEKIGDIYYWFDKDTNQFIAQGKNTDEIVAVLKSRFVDHVFITANYALVSPDFVPQPLNEDVAKKQQRS
jgi:hypothetical protein